MNHFLHPLYLPLADDPTPLSALSMNRMLHESISQALKFGIFEQLKTARSYAEVAELLKFDPQVTYYLLKALVELGCLAEEDGRFFDTPMAEAYLTKDSCLYLGHEFTALAGDLFGGLLAKRLKGKNGDKPPEPEWSQERLRQLGVLGLMGSIQSVVEACSLDNARTFLDLGGGHGYYSIALVQKYPELKATVFDLPHIVELARAFAKQSEVEGQVGFIGGNFMTDEIGQGYDAVLCANILHSSKRDIVLNKVYTALNSDGKIIVKTRVADAPNNLENAFNNLFWQVRGGKELFTTKQWRGFLAEHGFRGAKVFNIFGTFATIIARKEG
ncbi:MAG: aziB2 [Firmicutes bacterium]|nr:aziB2 [Bacillota bacterium]